MSDHSQLENTSTKHTLHKIGHVCADLMALASLTNMTESDAAIVQNPPSLYVYLSGVWVGTPLGGGGSSNAYNELSVDGQTIIAGVTNVAVGADSSHAIDPAILAGSDFRIYQSQGFVATISPPAGWSFSTGEETLKLGWWESVELHYYGGQVILVGPKNGGMAQ